MGRSASAQSGNSLGQVSTKATATSGHHVPLTVRVSATSNARSVQRAVPYTVSPLQTVVRSSATGEPRHPPPGLAEVSQVEAISNEVMAKYLELWQPFRPKFLTGQ